MSKSKIEPGEYPLKDLYKIADAHPDLRKSLMDWVDKWVVEYSCTDDLKDALAKAQGPDDATEILVKREQGVMQWLGARLAMDCSLSEKNWGGKKGNQRYSIVAFRKQLVVPEKK